MIPANITSNRGLIFASLENESFRVYEFDGGTQVRIENPVAVSLSSSGGHRILDGEGVSHYIPPTWIHLYWMVKEGKPHFDF